MVYGMDSEYHRLCAAIGFVVVNWSLTEHSLDGWVAIVYHDHGGKDLRKSIPKPLSAKVEFLTQCFQECPSLSEFKDEALALLLRVTALADKRHDLVHGAVTSVTSKDGVFAFAKLDFKKQEIRVRQVHLDLKKFDDLAKEIVDLGTDVADLGDRLLKGRLVMLHRMLKDRGDI
jgi:hypothetical protein